MNYQELYVVCQIEDFSLKVMVNNYEDNQIQVLFKECIDHEQFAENGVVINPLTTGNILKTIIEKINKILNIRIKSIALSLPSYNLKIYQSQAMLDFKDPKHLISNPDCNQIIEMTKNIIIDPTEIICLTKPYNFKIDQTQVQDHLPIGLKGQILKVDALIYSLPKTLYNSQLAVLESADYELLTITLDQFALACNINREDINDDNLILINWGLNNTKVSVFNNSLLYATTTIKIGFNQIVQSLMAQMRCGYDRAEKYLLKIININSKYLGDLIVDKYDDLISKSAIHLTNADLQKTVRKKINEIIDCIEYFCAGINDDPKTAIIFTGITIGLAGFTNYVKNYSKLKAIKFMINDTPGVDNFDWSTLIGITHYQHLVNVFNNNFLSSITNVPMILPNQKQQHYDYKTKDQFQQYNFPLQPNYKYNDDR